MYVDFDSIVVFLLMSAFTIGVWVVIAHIDTYFGYKKRFIKTEYRKDFTFWRFTIDQIKQVLGL